MSLAHFFYVKYSQRAHTGLAHIRISETKCICILKRALHKNVCRSIKKQLKNDS